MLLQRSGGRGSKYAKKIDPITMHIAYEGKEDEKEYFEAFSSKLSKRFRNTVRLIAVPKTTSASAPETVKNDLVAHLKKNRINLTRTKSHMGFIVIDKDHFFSKQHQRSTWATIADCNKRGITVLCSNPCFEIWLLCHYLDVASQSEKFKNDALRNKKANKNSKSYLKAQVAKFRKGEDVDAMLDRIEYAYNNEAKLKNISKDPHKLPPDDLVSNVGVIVKYLLDNGIPLFK
ncbi:RloB family protein [Vibrio diabolicus]|uniref:RloB family protein n=1 Tax=Vibrio diabolicus TaxID=50719 RepID=UPI00215F8882|nr:RloB family protein [Vibrio diabolicus]MCS0411118.1 RloB family protein [Vibrio diabolicus]MDV5044022.1 RloB family protein [Vibrio diabolicus]